jgi:hypothetical protein
MKNTFLLIISCMTMPLLHAQTIVVETGNIRRINTPISIELSDEHLQLMEVKGKQHKPVPFQPYKNRIYWLLDGINEPGSKRTFELVKASSLPVPATMQLKDSAGSLILTERKHPLLQYNYGMVYPPAGVDSMYRRSGFIHPLWAPDGQILTNMHPKDHWHHVGIWNPWTHTEFEGKETDFWNLQKKEGTVRFTSFESKTAGNIWCGFEAKQDHIAFANNTEKIALHEIWDIRAYNSGSNAKNRIWDFSSTLSCLDSPIELLQYRYGGGFALRATAAWNATNSKVLTSEGNTRLNADSTRARWIKITGNAAEGQAGILVLCAPDNYDFPQPLRVWPENSERGEIMMNYSPTKMKPWKLLPGNEYTQRYRIMVYENDITAEEAENAWQSFAHPPVVKITGK